MWVILKGQEKFILISILFPVLCLQVGGLLCVHIIATMSP